MYTATRRLMPLIVTAGCFLPSVTAAVNSNPVYNNRHDFIRLLKRIEEGMPKEKIAEIIGKPDDIRTPLDPGGISTENTAQIWCYGTRGRFTFPTLGCIYIDKNGKAQDIFGAVGEPPSATVFPEAELREILFLIDNSSQPIDGTRYNPLPVIRLVNVLHSMGKEKALLAVSEYLRLAPYHRWEAREGLFLRAYPDNPIRR